MIEQPGSTLEYILQSLLRFLEQIEIIHMIIVLVNNTVQLLFQHCWLRVHVNAAIFRSSIDVTVSYLAGCTVHALQ